MLNLFQSLKGQAHRLTPTFIIEPEKSEPFVDWLGFGFVISMGKPADNKKYEFGYVGVKSFSSVLAFYTSYSL